MAVLHDPANDVGPATILGQWAADVRYEDLPSSARDRAADVLLDAIACAFVGRKSLETAQIEHVADAIGRAGDATVVGAGTKSPAGACLLNGYQITAFTMCDIHHPTFCHIAPETLPPAMVIAERLDVSGQDLLAAVAVGMEIAVRVGLGLDFPTARARGWHLPGIVGPFGGAVAAGRLLGLDGPGLRAAMGLAGSQAAGTFAHWLTPTVKFQQARGGLGGLLAAELAATGFRTSEEIFTTPDGGLFHTHSDGGHPERLLAELGSRWELEQITLRRWPAAAGNQAVVEGVLDLIEEHRLRPGDVATVRVGLSATGHRMFGDVGWEDPFRALLSTRYVTSATLHDQRCWLEQFDPARLVDPAVDGFARERVDVRVDDSIQGAGASIEAVLHDGRTVTARHDIAKGDPSRPLSRGDLEAKFRDATADLLEPTAADHLLATLSDLPGQPSARQVIQSLRIPASEVVA